MTRKQKVGLESSATRARLLDAAEQLMRDEGYMAVTSRRVGNKAGVRPQLVHYYFPTMDDLFLALYRHRSDQTWQSAMDSLQSDQPLRAVWEKGKDSRDIALTLEFIALANHRKAIRAELAESGGKFRQLQHEAVEKYIAQRKIKSVIPPNVMSFLLTSIGLLLVLESQIGVSHAHGDVEAFIETVLRQFEDTGRLAPE